MTTQGVTSSRGTPYSLAALKMLAAAQDLLARYMAPASRLVPNRSITLNNLAVAAGLSLDNVTLSWPTDGLLVGIRASTQDGLLASMSATLLRVQQDGAEDVFSSGQGNGEGFVPFDQISGQNSSGGVYQLWRPFFQQANWQISLQNNAATNIVANVTFDIIDVRTPRVIP
jgi:hypothetical protein